MSPKNGPESQVLALASLVLAGAVFAALLGLVGIVVAGAICMTELEFLEGSAQSRIVDASPSIGFFVLRQAIQIPDETKEPCRPLVPRTGEDFAPLIVERIIATHAVGERAATKSPVGPSALAATFVGAVTEGARALAERIERELPRDETWSVEPRAEVLLTSLLFVLHATDRIAFAHMSPADRDLFMSTVLETLTRDGGMEELRAEYNAAQGRYSMFKELVPQEGKGTQVVIHEAANAFPILRKLFQWLF